MSNRELGLQLADVSKVYGSVTAVKSIDLDVDDGEFLTVLGPSGSGKSTILKMIAGFEAPTSGGIRISGHEVSTIPPSRRNIGMVFQNYALFPHLSVADNIGYGLKVRRWNRSMRSERIRELLTLVGLEGMERRLPRELSGGQQQRVALARALAFRPGLLLMDEPLGALDRELRIRMAGEIRRIHQETGTTIVYVTHDREEALTLSDRIAIMLNGSIDSLDTPERLYRTPRTSFAAAFFGGHNIVHAEVSEVKGGELALNMLGRRIVVRNPDGGGYLPGGTVDVSVPASAFELVEEGGIPLDIQEIVYMGDSTRLYAVGMRLLGAEPLELSLPGYLLDSIRPGDTIQVRLKPEECGVVSPSVGIRSAQDSAAQDIDQVPAPSVANPA